MDELDQKYEGIEDTGIGLKVMLDGFGVFRQLASDFFIQEGLGKAGPDGIVDIDPKKWYPLAPMVRALRSAAAQVGDQVAYEVGTQIPKNAVFPPQINSIESALASLDIAMHMNHRKNGKLMFDPATGEMTEGIGHLLYKKIEGKNEIHILGDTPFRCAMDHGLITAMARRFQPKAKCAHAPEPKCKDKGGTQCLYIVTW
jgi:hypothetical protein